MTFQVISISVAVSEARNPLKALQRLRQDPDSTEFLYLRAFCVNKVMPMNPYHLEIVSHSEIDEVCTHNVYDNFYATLAKDIYRSTDTKRGLNRATFSRCRRLE